MPKIIRPSIRIKLSDKQYDKVINYVCLDYEDAVYISESDSDNSTEEDANSDISSTGSDSDNSNDSS